MYNTIEEIRQSKDFKTDPQTQDILFSDAYLQSVDNLLNNTSMAAGDKEYFLARLDKNGNIMDTDDPTAETPAIVAVMREYDADGLDGLAKYDGQFLDVLETTKMCTAVYEAGLRASDFIEYNTYGIGEPLNLVSPAVHALQKLYQNDAYGDLMYEYEGNSSMFAEQDYIEDKRDLDREFLQSTDEKDGGLYSLCKNKDEEYLANLAEARQKFKTQMPWSEEQTIHTLGIPTDDITYADLTEDDILLD